MEHTLPIINSNSYGMQ